MSVQTVIVSPLYLAAVRYAQDHGYNSSTCKIVTDPQGLRGYGTNIEFIYVRGFGANLGVAVRLQEGLKIYKALGATVRYVG
jgi:hypothetical protein